MIKNETLSIPPISQTFQIRTNWTDIQQKVASSDYSIAKRVLVKSVIDRFIILLLLPILLPIMALIALAIKLDSRGSIFFLQERTGMGANTFSVYKFRTMTHVASQDDTMEQSQKEDMRHTRLGRFLRRTSLDELPQMLNVLKGDMSLIGPRPHARYHDELFLSLDPNYARRFRMKPGITGWAQVHGCRGLLEFKDQLYKRTAYDNAYIDQGGLWNECNIIWKTAMIMLRQDNA